MRAANQKLAERVVAFSKRKGTTPAQVALAWLLAQEPWIVPIPGTTKLHRLQENLGGAEAELTAEDLRSLAADLSEVSIQGERYTEQGMKLIDR